MEFFPEMNGLVAAANREVYFCNTVTKQWSRIAQNVPMSDQYHFFAEYNPVHKVIVCGGGNGSRKINKVDGNGNVTPLRDAPIGVGVTQTVFTCDPVSGKYLVLGNDVFYEYDVVSDSWTNLGQGAKPIFDVNRGNGAGGIAATPVSTYGVVMFIAWDFDRSKAMIYKHTESGTTGTEAQTLVTSPSITITPNPFQSAVGINVKTRQCLVSTINVYNTNGRMVDRILFKGSTTIWKPAGLPAGIYLLKTQIGGKTMTKKLVYNK
jgi:hypothetical protein